MYTAVSACLKQLAEISNTTFNHAFVYVIKLFFPPLKQKRIQRSLLQCPELQSDQISQCDVGPVFVMVHIACKCSWFNDMQVIQIMRTLLKAFQVCFNIHDSPPDENISREYVFWTAE